jgi:hypothetical protein
MIALKGFMAKWLRVAIRDGILRGLEATASALLGQHVRGPGGDLPGDTVAGANSTPSVPGKIVALIDNHPETDHAVPSSPCIFSRATIRSRTAGAD